MDWLGIVSIAVSIITVTTFIISRKDAAIREGEHVANVKQLRVDMDKTMAQVEVLRDGHNDVDKGLEILKNDMGYIKVKLDDIFRMMEKRGDN